MESGAVRVVRLPMLSALGRGKVYLYLMRVSYVLRGRRVHEQRICRVQRGGHCRQPLRLAVRSIVLYAQSTYVYKYVLLDQLQSPLKYLFIYNDKYFECCRPSKLHSFRFSWEH
jgi:hypothetical protein